MNFPSCLPESITGSGTYVLCIDMTLHSYNGTCHQSTIWLACLHQIYICPYGFSTTYHALLPCDYKSKLVQLFPMESNVTMSIPILNVQILWDSNSAASLLHWHFTIYTICRKIGTLLPTAKDGKWFPIYWKENS